MRNLILFLAVLTGLYSCSCSYHIKRIKNKCGVEKDTVWRVDTTIVDRVEKDSIFYYHTKDTVIIREGKLTMKYFYNHSDSTVYLNGECDSTIIVKSVPVEVNKYVQSTPFWVYICLGLAGLSIIFLMFKR